MKKAALLHNVLFYCGCWTGKQCTMNHWGYRYIIMSWYIALPVVGS